MSTALSLDLDCPIDYRPRPPLDIDPRPIAPGELRGWREGLWRERTQYDLADIFGVTQSRWSQMELNGLSAASAGWCALIREWFANGLDIPSRIASIGEIKAVAALVGGWLPLSEALGKPHGTLLSWSQRGVPSRGGYGELFGWLADEFGVEPIDEVPKRSLHKVKISRLEVIDIRRRHARGGITIAQLAREKDVSWTTIANIVKRRTWKWVK